MRVLQRTSDVRRGCRGGRSVTALQPAIRSRILELREQRVMLDADLAQLYGVETRVLVQAVNAT